MSYESFKQECARFGFVAPTLSADDYQKVIDAGLSDCDAYGIGCDIVCEFFDTVDEGIDYYR